MDHAHDEQSQWEMLKFDPATTHELLKPSSPNLACVITSWIPSTKTKLGTIRLGVISPHIGEIYTQNDRMLTTFFWFFQSPNRAETPA